jgi:hypothetical protein
MKIKFIAPASDFASTIVESQRDIPYGPRNLQKFAHFYVLSAHYIALPEPTSTTSFLLRALAQAILPLDRLS